MKTPRPLLLLLGFSLLLLLAGCGAERGDKAIAYGKEFGRDWVPAGPNQIRVAVQNSFTRDAILVMESAHGHYELTVGPIRDRYFVIPDDKYEIQVLTYGREVGNCKFQVLDDTRGSAKGMLIQVRP